MGGPREQLRGGFRPCLVVLDMAMPEMDGYSFRRAQLADPELVNIPVAVVSGAGWAVERDARALGLKTFLRKPIDPDQLLAAIDGHCRA
jgi:CheY-like chemotaxis protein